MAKEVLIVGGGLSGLYLAHRLKQSDPSYRVTVLESRRRLGGRLESAQTSAGESDEVDAFDLGGSWFWPSSQPLVDSLLEELGMESFAQYEEGDLLIERSQTRQAQRLDPRGAGMGDARRLRGGMRSLVEALADRVGRNNVVLGCKVTGLRLVDGNGAGKRVQATSSGGQCLEADRVVLALPPRLAASNGIEFGPPLPTELGSSWAATATWMAPHAKYVAVYDRPFWREQKLSGNAHSTAGPLGEIHDATNYDGSLGALFGFFSIQSSARQAQSEDELKSGVSIAAGSTLWRAGDVSTGRVDSRLVIGRRHGDGGGPDCDNASQEGARAQDHARRKRVAMAWIGAGCGQRVVANVSRIHCWRH
ncbi:hypothetical protein L1887_53558 [Cichorium endivia]|nr:hypothetical protein L1887_53558 [Cichorium endivia]